MKLCFKRLAAVITLSLLVAPIANAAIVTWTFTGSVSEVLDGLDNGGIGPNTIDPFGGIFFAGDSFSASLTMDTSSPATPSSGLGSHEGAFVLDQFSITNRGIELTRRGSEYLHINATTVNPVNRGVLFGMLVSSNTFDVGIGILDFIFTDWNIPVPTDLDSLANDFDLSLINNSIVSLNYSSGANVPRVNFTVDSATASISTVPVPAAAWLFGSGFAGLIAVAKRKKA